MRLRHALAGARTPAYRTVWKRGGAAQGGEPGEPRQRVHFHSERPVGEGPLQDDAHEAVWPQLHARLREGRAQNVPEKRLLPRGVLRAGPRRGVQGEAVERRAERLVVPERAGSLRGEAPLPRGARGWRLARDGGRLEPPLGIVVALVVVAALEQTPAAELPRHPPDRMFEHVADLARLQVPRRAPSERGALFAVDTVEDEGVKAGMEPKVGRSSLDDGTRARLARRRARALRVERLDALEEDTRERAVAGQAGSPRKREREHPLPERGFAGRTRSVRFAAVAHMRLPMHEGQKPRPLHENATSRLSAHAPQRSLAKPRHSTPQLRYASSSFFACFGTRTPSTPSSMAPYTVSRLSRTTSYNVVVSGR